MLIWCHHTIPNPPYCFKFEPAWLSVWIGKKKVTQDMIWMNVWSVCRKGILITILSKIKIVSANDRLIECKLYSMGHSIKLANFTTVSIRKKKNKQTTTITSPQTNNKQTDITNNKQTNIQPKNSASCNSGRLIQP